MEGEIFKWLAPVWRISRLDLPAVNHHWSLLVLPLSLLDRMNHSEDIVDIGRNSSAVPLGELEMTNNA